MTNKQNAEDFLIKSSKGQSRAAFELYVSEDFIHHNTYFKGDRKTLMLAMEENAKKMPAKVFEILRSLEDGNLVAIHSHMRPTPNDLGVALVHIFRFEGNKIVELWDLGQPVPAETVNDHGMF